VLYAPRLSDLYFWWKSCVLYLRFYGRLITIYAWLGPLILLTLSWCRSVRKLKKLVTTSSVSTGPGRGPRPLRSNMALVQSRNIFWTGLGPRVAFALLFLFISYKRHFTSATKNKVIGVTASMGWISCVIEQ